MFNQFADVDIWKYTSYLISILYASSKT